MVSEKKYVLSGFNYLIALQSIARLVLNILQFLAGQYYIGHYIYIIYKSSILVKIWVYLAYSMLKYKLGYCRWCF